MKDAILRSVYGYAFAVGVFSILPPMDPQWSLLILTVAFVPGWHCYNRIEKFLKEDY